MEDIPGFSGFENFTGFPKTALAEASCEYYIYPPTSSLDLKTLKSDIETYIKPWTDEFIWQQDPFELEIVVKDGNSYLKGTTEFGDSIDDEWFIVFLLREISRHWPELWIRTIDTDGEYLLIEAAHALPRWLSPETADSRVWIHNSQLLIIPRSPVDKSAGKSGTLRSLTSTDALKYVRTGQGSLLHIKLVEEEAFYRIARYTSALKEHFHHAIVTLPRVAAAVLKQRPKSVSKIVEAVYTRDPIGMRVCETMPVFGPRDVVNVSVRFTRILYAQMRQQEFRRVPGPFILPPEGTEGRVRSEMGMKICCGLEMIVDESRGKKTGREKVEREEIMKIVEEGKMPSDEDIKGWEMKADGEEWMDVDYDEFEAELSGRGKAGREGEGGAFGDKEQQDKLKKMVENFTMFMNDQDAGMDGANLDDDDEEEEDDDGDISTEDEDEDDEGEDKEASFDEAQFAKLMREMMGFPPEIDTPDTSPILPEEENEQSDDDSEEHSIRATMAKMEAELVEAGAIEKDRPGSSFIYNKKGKTKGTQKAQAPGEDGEEDVDVDYAVAKNMLESLKSQGGMSGPAGNLLRSMGVSMPRDDDEDDEDEDEGYNEETDDLVKGKVSKT